MMNTGASKQLFVSAKEGLRTAIALNHGGPMPRLGLGVYQMRDDAATVQLLRHAIACGYRSIDTAKIYGNERSTGEAIRTCGVPREELFITTKAWNDDIRADRVEAAFEESLKRLRLDYIDLYLLHWPILGKLVPAWRVLEKLQRFGRVKAIGVSNYLIPHLEELLPEVEIVPAVNQIEFHPRLQSRPLIEYCRDRGIAVEAWSPLMQAGEILREPRLLQIARTRGKTVAQVILRWDIQRGVITIPKSSHEARVIENADIFDFTLSEDEMAAIAALDRGRRVGPDPMTVDF